MKMELLWLKFSPSRGSIKGKLERFLQHGTPTPKEDKALPPGNMQVRLTPPWAWHLESVARNGVVMTTFFLSVGQLAAVEDFQWHVIELPVAGTPANSFEI